MFSSGNQPARIKQAKLEIKKNENSIQELSEALKFQEQQAQNNLTSAKDQVKLQQTNIELAKKIYENAVIKEQIGKINSILVSQKYNQLIQSQAQYIGSVINLFNAQLQLDQLYNTINK